MSKETINNALYSLYGVPIIGEWLYDTTEETWGSHGGKLIISDKGIQFEQTTKPYGFVTKEAAENAEWVTITEEDGFTQHEYLQLKGCILWTDRYDEATSILKENFGQSMEIEIQNGRELEDGYYDISQFVFSALCILGTAEPCFESASIGRHYEQNGFVDEINKMKKAYAKFIEEKKTTMNETVLKLLSDRYAALSINDNEVICVDREDNFKLKAIPYSIAEKEGEDNAVVFDFENAAEKYFACTDEQNDFSIAAEIERVVDSRTEQAVAGYINQQVAEFESQIEEAEKKYQELLSQHNEALEKIDAFETSVREREFAIHQEEIDAKLEEYSDKLKNCAEYLLYRAKVDYKKTVDEIDTDLALILGRYSKDKKDKKSFSMASYSVPSVKTNNSREQERYGSLLENVD